MNAPISRPNPDGPGQLYACHFCRGLLHDGEAVACPNCGAYKRKGRWRHPGDDLYEVRRNTNIVALMAVLIMLGAVLVAFGAFQQGSSSTRPSTSFCREYPALC